MAKVLNDFQLFDFHVKPSDGTNKAVLCTLEGYATFHDKVNRNNRFYPGDFWKRHVDVPRVREMLDTKTFFGCARHPGRQDSPIPEFEEVSHAIRDYKFDDNGVWVTLDVLDTASGRAIKTLVDYGSSIGISTRAFGDQKQDDQGRLVPDDTSYKFVTWDLVTFPAFSDARLSAVNDAFDIELSEEDVSKFPATREDLLSKLSSMDERDAKTLADMCGLDWNPDAHINDAEASEIQRLTDEVQSLRQEIQRAASEAVDAQTPTVTSDHAGRLEAVLEALKDEGPIGWSLTDETSLDDRVAEMVDVALREHTDTMKALHESYSSLKQELADRDLEIAKLNELLDEHEAQAEGMLAGLEARDADLSDRDQKIKVLNSQLAATEAQLQDAKASTGNTGPIADEAPTASPSGRRPLYDSEAPEPAKQTSDTRTSIKSLFAKL